ncbi:MAG: hypothetical protein COA42_07785 [Alteromonadaceae bacterium]|nr:MAG: hypothetical protein COA42_07785 [Alteromonadaceae bacterium]
MLSIFQRKPLIDDNSAQWIFDTFEWALTHFDKEEFFSRARLIQPSSEFFPGRVNSVHEKAESIFEYTKNYAGLAHWPIKLQAPQEFLNMPTPFMDVQSIERNSSKDRLPMLTEQPLIFVPYGPQQTLKAEDLSASFAHVLAQHLVVQSQQLPPGGKDYAQEASEVLAVFMGFGVMFANSAYTFRGSCARCHVGGANRQASLSEDGAVFALALFCQLKGISTREATGSLKSYLKSNYKRAVKQIERNEESFAKLKQYA